jgi:hypothetical protein
MDENISEIMCFITFSQSIKHNSDLTLELITLSLRIGISFHLVSKVLFISSISISSHGVVFLMNCNLIFGIVVFFNMASSISASPDARLNAEHNGNASKDCQHKSCLD